MSNEALIILETPRARVATNCGEISIFEKAEYDNSVQHKQEHLELSKF